MRLFIRFFLILICWAEFCESATENSGYSMKLVNSMNESGVFKDAHIVGKLVYCATGRGIEIVDISDYTKPNSVGKCATPGEAVGIYVSENYAYVSDGTQGLRIIDVFDPTKPREVGCWKVKSETASGGLKVKSYIMDVVIDRNYAYIVDCGYGMRVIDISYPNYPREIGGVRTSGSAYGIAIKSQKYAYIANYSDGLKIIDISEPDAPYEIGNCKIPGMALKVALFQFTIHDSRFTKLYALVATGNEGLWVVDVSEPENPKIVSSYRKGRIMDVAISGSNAWLADLDCRIRVLDISDILNLREVCVLDKAGPYEYTHSIAINDFLVCVCNLRAGLSFFDVSQAGNPREVGCYNAVGQSYALDLEGNYLYSAQYENGLRIIDIENPESPLEIGHYDTDGAVWDISLSKVSTEGLINQVPTINQISTMRETAISSDDSVEKIEFYACVADDVGGFWVIDVRQPSSPELCSKYKTPEYARGISAYGNYAYVANYSGGLSIMDISKPSSPREIGRYESVGYIWDVEYASNYCYLASAEEGLLVIDVRDAKNPREVGRYNTHGYVWSLALAGNYCYLADGDCGLRIMDISNPCAPFEVGHFFTDGCATGITIGNPDENHSSLYAYIADGNAGIVVVDVHKPSYPREVGRYDTPGYARDIKIYGDYIFVADSEGGIITLKVKNE